MHPLKLTILMLLFLTLLRLLVPIAKRPKGSALIPLAALALSSLHFVTVGTDIEMVPAFLLALFATIGVVWEFWTRRRATGTEPMTRSYLSIAARTASVVGAAGLFGLTLTSAFLWNRSDPLIRGPEALPRMQTLEMSAASQAATSQTVTIVADHSYLRIPRDLEFNPRVNGQLWIVNGADNSVAIIHDAHMDARSIEYRRDGQAAHFMHRPSAIAFGSDHTTIGVPGSFATAQESHDDAIPFMARNFMGPTLFSSDLNVFAHHPGPGLSGSHLDMLHESPFAMGIAWERDHVYWVFGGYLGNIVRYDFVADHGIGQHDHSNGLIRHYGQNVVKHVPGVPSHLALHHATNTLFIADTGNSRILALDITSGSVGEAGPGWEPGVDTRYMNGAVFTELVPAGIVELPSGLELYDEQLFVSDHATGIIHLFNLEGNPVATINTGLGQGALMGMTFGPDEMLYFVDAAADRILRLDPSHYIGSAQAHGERQPLFTTATPTNAGHHGH